MCYQSVEKLIAVPGYILLAPGTFNRSRESNFANPAEGIVRIKSMATHVSPGFSVQRVICMLGGITLLMLSLVVCQLRAQTPTSSIVGTVKDAQGLSVAGAIVTLTNQQTNYDYAGVTSSVGAYQFQSLDYGVYRVTVQKPGFRNGVVENIKLDAATSYSVPPISLELGVATDSVVVEGGAELVNTTSVEVSSTVEKKQIDDLPIFNRNPLALLTLEAGINVDPSGNQSTTIGGQRAPFSNLTLDGINIQDNFIRTNGLDFSPNLPFNSQASEFTVINQNAEVDKGAGASQVSIVTPKGTNEFHGEGFWYYRTNAFAANDWFNAASGVKIPHLLQNQGGGNFGGPIKKDKLFVYGYYEFLRLRQQTPENTTVLSPTILAALSSGNIPFQYQPVDQTTGNPSGPSQTVNLLNFLNMARGNPVYDAMGNYLGGAPLFAVDPAIATLLQRMPTTPNNDRVGDGINLRGYQFNQRSNNSLNNYGARVDYDINAHNTVTGTWAWNHQTVDRTDGSLAVASFNVVPLSKNDDSTKFLSTAWRWNPTPAFTNEVRFGFNLAPGFFTTSQNFSSGYVLDDTSLPYTDPNPNFLPQGRNTRTWAWSDNASWSKGNHIVKFGAQIQRVTIFATNSGGIYPTYSLGFSAKNPFAPQVGDFPVGSSTAQVSTSDLNNASSILGTLAGILSTVTQTDNVTSRTSGYVAGAPESRNYRQNQWMFYLGDNWKINRKLTLTYGTRWEYYSPIDEKGGLVLLPVVPAGSNINTTLLGNAKLDFAGGTSGRPLYRQRLNQFAPNIGIAWDPFGNGKTAVRAGFSINYVNDEFFTAAENAARGNTGLSANPSTGAIAPPSSNNPAGYAGPTVTNPQGKNSITPPPFGIPTDLQTNAFNNLNAGGIIGDLAAYGIDPNLKTPYVEQWNLSLQHDIGWNTSLTVSYVGNHGVGLLRAIDLNQLNLQTQGYLASFNQARYNGFQSVAAGQGFNPDYAPASCGGCAAPTLLDTVLGPFINFGPFANLIYQGQAGGLLGNIHADGFDYPGALPGPPGTNLLNSFANPYIMGADLLKNTSSSTYNAGIVELRRRFNRGLYFQANYTYSKTMTDFGGSASQFQPFQDNARPRLEKARAPFDLTHVFKANFTYELPIGKGHHLFNSGNRVVGLLVDGWQTGSIFTWQSGSPFSILSKYATFNRSGSRSVNNTAYATLTHGQINGDLGVFVQPGGVVYVLNPKLVNPDGTGVPTSPQLSCAPSVPGGFCNPQPGQTGNLQLDAFSGPRYFDWDLSAAKDFNVTERIKLTFRTEAFNLLNHPVFYIGDQDINSQKFGQSTTTSSTPRILQMSLRVKF